MFYSQIYISNRKFLFELIIVFAHRRHIDAVKTITCPDLFVLKIKNAFT